MGRTWKWFLGVLGKKEAEADVKSSRRRWSFGRSYREKHHPIRNNNIDRKKPPTIAVLTKSTISPTYVPKNNRNRQVWAAIKIQASFRAYLARKALKALKALVKLQALVRGHVVRKQTAYMMRRMQALLRVQAKARAWRARISHSPLSLTTTPSKTQCSGPATPEKFEQSRKGKRLFNSSSHVQEGCGVSAENCSSDCWRESLTHSKSDNCCPDEYGYPNYMACTESSRAKARSMSVPKQRPSDEICYLMKPSFGNGVGEERSSLKKGPALRVGYGGKGYPGSGRLDRLGMPVGRHASA